MVGINRFPANLFCAVKTDKICIVHGQIFASAAAGTFIPVEKYFRLKGLTLGIVTPRTRKRTTL